MTISNLVQEIVIDSHVENIASLANQLPMKTVREIASEHNVKVRRKVDLGEKLLVQFEKR